MNPASTLRSRIAQSLASFLTLVLIAVVMLGANPLEGETIGPFDFLVNFPGWKNTGIESTVQHRKHSDILDAKLPSWRYAREKLRQGELPIWNPHVLGGNPLLLLNTRSILTPAFAAYASFDSEATGLYASALVNLLIISFGSYLLLFSLTENRIAALLGAVAFSYSGFNTSWFLWHHVNTSIWIPWLLFFAVRIAQTGDAKYVPWLAIASTMLILGGFPTVAVYGYIALLLLFVSWALFSRNSYQLVLSRGGLGVAAILLSFMITMVVLYCLEESLSRIDLSYRRGGSAFKKATDYLLYIQPLREGRLTLGRTAYVGLIPLLLFIPALWLTWKNRFNWKYVWGLSLVVVIAPLAFAWIPIEYIRKIPLIGTSMINRLHLIIGLGFALLSALVLSVVYRRLGKNAAIWSSAGLVLLLTIQVFDQRRVFQTLVGYVKAETIYPNTATIDFVKTNLKPLQNVVADRGYIVSGVVSAYGLSEWFAHGFHTQAEKKLLYSVVNKPFLTPTASAFLCRQINFSNAKFLGYLGIKYALCSYESKHRPKGNRIPVFNSVNSIQDESKRLNLLENRVVQHFELVDMVMFDELDVVLARVDGEKHPNIRLKLWMESGPLTESAPCDLQRESNSASLQCKFPERVILDKGRYEMGVLVENQAKSGASLEASVYPSGSLLFKLRVGDSLSDNLLGWSGYLRPGSHIYQAVLKGEIDGFKAQELEPGVVLVENNLVEGSAYFVDSLDGMPAPRYDLLSLNHYTDTAMKFDYLGDEPGWVVIPVRMYPGWKALVNGKSQELKLFKGVLPAVRVSGGDTVDFVYSLEHYAVSAVISFIGVLLCLFVFLKAQLINRWLAEYSKPNQ
jgi:hypothetical protein